MPVKNHPACSADRTRAHPKASATLAAVLWPRPLRPGDRVIVVAPSSPFDRALALEGIAWLSTRYKVVWDEAIFEREGFLAGSDERRSDELARAFSDPRAAAILAARGGYGLSRIAHELPWDALLEAPKWIVGFSDITALHIETATRKLASVHASMACGLGKASEIERTQWLDTLEAPLARRQWTGLDCVRDGVAKGPLFGGNLCLLHAWAAAGRLKVPHGSLVLLEDVGERPYRVDRMLTGLIVGGHFERAAGIVLGDFTDCHPGPEGTTIEAVLRERLGGLGIPVAMGLPVGHGARNDAIVLGAPASLDASRGVLEVGGE